MFGLESHINAAISQGIMFIDTQQQEDGSFLSLSSPNPKSFTNAIQFHSTFSTALILDALTSIPATPQLNEIKQKAAKFLLTQKSDIWSFNYWTRNAKEAKEMPYPDDLDDTFCALAALYHYDKKIIDGSVLAHMVRVLTAAEEQPGGPYRTWLVSQTAEHIWKDVDIAVNSNVAYFLSLQEIDLPQLHEYIDLCIKKNKLTSPYYPSEYSILYFLSRFYKGKHKNDLQQVLFSKKNKKNQWSSSLTTALAVTALLHFQTPAPVLTAAIQFLLNQQSEGAWQPEAFYTGVNPKKDKTYYAGSAALTTAFCLEGLATYLKAISVNTQNTGKESAKREYIYNQVVKKVEERFSVFDTAMKKNVDTMLQDMLAKDTQKHIVLLPFYFTETLGNNKKNISEDLVIQLGTANLFGWIAYTIYDNFLDDEGEPKMLDTANIALRELTKIFEQALPEKTKFKEFFHGIMDQLDQANTWEVTHCRIKITKSKMDFTNFQLPHYDNYQKLAQKSLGHALGPLAILFSLGYTKDSSEVKNFLTFFTHYLIARQLHDDAHDWEQDLRMGHTNAVGTLLLQQISQKEISLKKLLPKLQKLFWYTVIEEVCALVYEHTNQARIALKKCSAIVDYSFYEQLLIRYEKASKIALEERKNAIKFLHVYNV
jgi:hypothetical protein